MRTVVRCVAVGIGVYMKDLGGCPGCPFVGLPLSCVVYRLCKVWLHAGRMNLSCEDVSGILCLQGAVPCLCESFLSFPIRPGFPQSIRSQGSHMVYLVR